MHQYLDKNRSHAAYERESAKKYANRGFLDDAVENREVLIDLPVTLSAYRLVRADLGFHVSQPFLNLAHVTSSAAF
jgi:hypothetical protein